MVIPERLTLLGSTGLSNSREISLDVKLIVYDKRRGPPRMLLLEPVCEMK